MDKDVLSVFHLTNLPFIFPEPLSIYKSLLEFFKSLLLFCSQAVTVLMEAEHKIQNLRQTPM